MQEVCVGWRRIRSIYYIDILNKSFGIQKCPLTCFLDISILAMIGVLMVLEMKIHEKYLGYWKIKKKSIFYIIV